MTIPNAHLPAMRTSPKVIFFTDFDGTITMSDSNDFMTDNIGFGTELRKQGNADVLHDRKSFRDSFKEMMDSITTPYNECIDLLKANIKLDPHFKEFYEWAKSENIPVVVLSSGMAPIIRALLVHYLGDAADEIEIVSNDVEPRHGKGINEKGGWQIVFHDNSHFGHDKSIEIRKYSSLPDGERPILLYAGDGVSDLSAAKETDLLFAKKGHDLIQYCLRENVPFTEFEDWSTILSTTKDIAAGKTTVQEVSAAGAAAAKNSKS
ncbi:HAD-like domain-containing protein [Xylogone sp. PMI_703]|nr:HAD-like domain-containing protein [Xylogone sp. PMI_703]